MPVTKIKDQSSSWAQRRIWILQSSLLQETFPLRYLTLSLTSLWR